MTKVVFLMMFIFCNIFSFAQDVKITQLSVSKITENAFGPFVFENNLYYCLDRGRKSGKKFNNQDGRVFLDLFSIGLKQKNKTFGKPQRLSDTLNSPQNEGPIQVSGNGRYLFYSKNLTTHQGDSAENKLGIFISESVNGSWGVPEPFPFNTDSYNVAHPTVNASVTTMIFSSDREDGFGGADLYVSTKENGKWTEPQNLGDIINSTSSESFPYLVNGDVLYFTSNREGGLGGMDLYKSIKLKGKWQTPTLLESPINSAFDDFCYFLNKDGKSGYFSSNRDDNTDGLYYFEKKIPEPLAFVQQEIQFCYKITDSVMEEAEDLEFTWDMGDGTKLNGLFVEHCYKDTGVFITTFSVYEKSMDRTYYPAASGAIVIDAKGLPVIEYVEDGGKLKFTINNKWSLMDYDSFYWEVDGVKIFESEITTKADLDKIRLIVWVKKQAESAKGIELLLKNEK